MPRLMPRSRPGEPSFDLKAPDGRTTFPDWPKAHQPECLWLREGHGALSFQDLSLKKFEGQGIGVPNSVELEPADGTAEGHWFFEGSRKHATNKASPGGMKAVDSGCSRVVPDYQRGMEPCRNCTACCTRTDALRRFLRELSITLFPIG